MSNDRTPEQRHKGSEEEKGAEAKYEKSGMLGLGFVLAILVAITLWTLLGPGERPSAEQEAASLEAMAVTQCQNFVRDTMESTLTVDFPFFDPVAELLADDTYSVMSYVDTKDGPGEAVRTNWSCRVRFDGGSDEDESNWTLVDLQTN